MNFVYIATRDNRYSGWINLNTVAHIDYLVEDKTVFIVFNCDRKITLTLEDDDEFMEVVQLINEKINHPRDKKQPIDLEDHSDEEPYNGWSGR